MAQIKNEHIIYAYAPLLAGSNILIIGVTDIGWEYLKKEHGNFLDVKSPGPEFLNVKQVIVVHGKDKKDIRDMMFKMAENAGVKITEAH